VIISSVWRIAV